MCIRKHFPQNFEGNDYIVGDIHGMYSLLMESLKLVNFNTETDRLFSVGDVIDRGPENTECVDLYYTPWFHTVRGNHEQMMIDAEYHKLDRGMWLYNGGSWGENYKGDLEGVCQDLEYRLPYLITIDTPTGITGIVHAEAPNNDLRNVLANASHREVMSLIWGRTKINQKDKTPVKGVDNLYVGHTPVPREGLQLGNVHYIDHGNVFNKEPFKLYKIN